MTEKRLCVIDNCDYCPYLETIKISKKIESKRSSALTVNHNFYKCNKTLLCVESGRIYLKNPLQLLFKYCPLPNLSVGDLND